MKDVFHDFSARNTYIMFWLVIWPLTFWLALRQIRELCQELTRMANCLEKIADQL